MIAIVRSLLALLASIFLLLMGNSLQFVVLGLRAEAEHFPTFIIGLLTAGYYGGYALGTSGAVWTVKTFGHVRAFAASASLISAVVIAHAVWVQPTFWILLRVLTGFCFAVAATVIESWLNAKATSSIRGTVLSLGSVALMSGYAVGPLMLSFGSATGFKLFVLASILMSVALVPVLLTTSGAPPMPLDSDEGYPLRRLYRECPVGLAATIGIGLIQGAFLGLGPVFAGRLGLSELEAARFMTCGLLAGIVLQYPLGALSDRIDRRTVLSICFTGLGVGSAFLAFILPTESAAQPLLLLAAAVAGVAAMPLYSIVVAQVNDRISEDSLVPAAATLILSFSLGSIFSGPVASAAIEQFGPAGLFGYFAAVLLGLALYSGYAKNPELPHHEEPLEYESFSVSTMGGLLPLEPVEEGEPEQLVFDFDQDYQPSLSW